MDSIFTVKICISCGISNLDGDPDYGIPFKNVETRQDGTMLCDDCARMSDLERVKKLLKG